MDTFIQQAHQIYLPAWFAPRAPAPYLDYGFTKAAHEASGVPEPALRLLLTILAGYPISILYRLIFLNRTSSIIGESARNWFFVVTGLLLSYYFNSFDIVHPLTTSVGTWLICVVFGKILSQNRTLASTISFFFNFGYLLVSYRYAATEEYDICYTMQQCVQCLRMIGFGMDFMDGQPKKTKSAPAPAPAPAPALASVDKIKEKKVDQPSSTVNAAVPAVVTKTPISFGRDIALADLPSLAETVGYAFFPFAFLVGPQFSFSLYKKFLSMKLFDVARPIVTLTTKEGEVNEKEGSVTTETNGSTTTTTTTTAHGIPQGSLRYATRCFVLGVFYLGLGQVLGDFFPTAGLVGKAFLARPLAERLFIFWWTGKTVLNKYLGIWTIAEGPCVLSGITFNGYDAQGKPEWDGLRNVDPIKYEFATSLAQIIGSFNMNTNFWAKLYVFKRLRFLGNKNLSALGVLLFLATWHGTHIGYFLCFGLEFLDMETERRLSARFGKPVNAFLAALEPGLTRTVLSALWSVFTWLLTTSALYFAAVPFDLLQLDKSYEAIKSIHFLGVTVMFGLLALDIVLSIILPKKRSSKSVKTE